MMKEKTPILAIAKDIKRLLEKGISEGVFPSAAAGISCGLGKEKKEVFSYCGNASLYPEKRKINKNSFYDLASLTKPLAATLATLCLIKENKIDIDEKLDSLLGKKIKGKQKKITTRNLLSHSSGLPAHREYFKILRKKPRKERSRYVEKLILLESMEYEPETTSIYSDLGFILLGRIIEKKAGCSLAHYVSEKVFGPLNLEKKVFYNPLFQGKKNIKKRDFAATEECPWRKKILCGEVHDDNCYAMGGISGHSGLFGSIVGVTKLAATVLDLWKGETEHPNINKKDLGGFLRQAGIPGSSWALGFDTPALTESSSGKYLSHKSVGHLGFTGTSFWIDPEKEVVIVLLSNRVHPSRENSKIKKFRPYFHDRIMKKLSRA